MPPLVVRHTGCDFRRCESLTSVTLSPSAFFMKKEINKKGYPPTVREICTALDIKSTSTVHKDLEALSAEGRIVKDPSKPRALQIVEEENRAPLPSDSYEREDVIDIPVIGRIAAGTPILAEENIEDSIPVPARYLGKGNYFMLTVHDN